MERPSATPEIIYNRTGNLAAVTQLDGGKAYEYMRRTDMRRWIVIADSDEKPQGQATQVGSDVLAWRRIIPIIELLSTRFRPQSLHTLTRDDAGPAPVWQIAVHERVIDKQIRDSQFIDRTDYEAQFLQKLNKAVKSGLLEALRREKLGWHDQKRNYLGNAFAVNTNNLAAFRSDLDFLTGIVCYFLILNPILNGHCNQRYEGYRFDESYVSPTLPPDIISRNFKLAFLPPIPVENWFAGERFFARNGQAMIVRKQD